MESGKGQAEKQEKRDGFDNIPKYNVSIISDGTADREKEHEGSAAGESHLHHDLKRRQTSLPGCRCAASAAIQRRKLGVHSTKSPAGAVQSAQWRELDKSSSRAPAEFPAVMRCPVGSRSFASRPLAVEPPTGKKHEGCAPSYSAAGENHLHPGKQVCRLGKFRRNHSVIMSLQDFPPGIIGRT